MPGHKGRGRLGCEKYDITEIKGADVLYSPSGIILESENTASEIFNTGHTFYSTEGATLAIKAMLAIVKSHSDSRVVLATRNAHKSFIYASALLDLTPVWIDEKKDGHLCKSDIDVQALSSLIERERPMAIYVTSPDYLGNILDISALSHVARNSGIPLLVDNAHGAYLHFLNESCHPIDLGATMCADSAHKTLPALTGTAYLHISKDAPCVYFDSARECLSLFASSSPSYLLLASLDKTNAYLSAKARHLIAKTVEKVEKCKQKLTNMGFFLEKSEPLKITLNCIEYGYKGFEIAEHLRRSKIECEYSDEVYLVLMASHQNSSADFKRLLSCLSRLPRREKIVLSIPSISSDGCCMPISQALFSKCETVSINDALGRICQSVSVSCPPAIPIVICGQRINEEKQQALKFYGVKEISVVKE